MASIFAWVGGNVLNMMLHCYPFKHVQIDVVVSVNEINWIAARTCVW